MSSDPQKWYDALSEDHRAIALALRQLILGLGAKLREEIKWGQPCFSATSLVCYIQKSKTHVSLGFGRGADLADPGGLLQGSGNQMRHLKIPLKAAKIDRDRLGHLLLQAIALDASQLP